ncbi:hypothetical protein BX600DRAFT_375872 [Xylariales sp. PMI_506]|nr:hypothetical protein BX600DRAFT_375872 [Xylariales sp. PMI_506]
MAVRPGEENVATLFGDVHYFYGPPTAKPPHHRFDKGSYVYLFENANDRRARIEVANNAGTDDQDAFDGFLDKTRVRYSYNQQCLVNITVDGIPGTPPSSDNSQWHLPTYDPHNQNIYHYKLHSLDIYFWTQRDALQFVNGIRRVLPSSQVEVLDEPGPPPRTYSQSSVNPLVQKLESTVISEHSSTSSRGTPQPQQQGGIGVPTFDPPPVATRAVTAVHGSAATEQPPAGFVPMAYNPAAPAAPEQVQHREKTPPPPEDDGVDPLRAAVAGDHAAPYTPGFGGPLSPPMSPGYPVGLSSPGFAPPQFGHLQRAATMPLGSPGLQSPFHASHAHAAAAASAYPGSPGFAPPPSAPPTAQSANAQQQHTPPPPPPPGPPPASQQQQQPPGGYANYNYSNPVGGGLPQQPDYNIHQQVWRPTETEHYVKHKPKPETRTKLGENAERLERGVSGMLKKFEKKWA